MVHVPCISAHKINVRKLGSAITEMTLEMISEMNSEMISEIISEFRFSTGIRLMANLHIRSMIFSEGVVILCCVTLLQNEGILLS